MTPETRNRGFFCGRVSTENGSWDNQWLSHCTVPTSQHSSWDRSCQYHFQVLWKGVCLFFWNLLQVLEKKKVRKAREVAGAYRRGHSAVTRIWVELVLQTDNRWGKDVLAADGPLSCWTSSYELILRVLANILVFTITFAQTWRKNVINSIKTVQSIQEHFMLAGDQANFSIL